MRAASTGAGSQQRADGWHICWLPPLADGTLAIYFGLWCGGDCVLWTAPVAAPPAPNRPATTLGAPMLVPAEVPNAHPQCLRKLLPESDAAWTSLRPQARWHVCVCGGKHAALPAFAAAGLAPPAAASPRPTAESAQPSSPPHSRLVELDRVLLDAMLPPLQAALAPLADARVMLGEAHAAISRLIGRASLSGTLDQVQAQLQAATARLDELHSRLAPAPKPAAAAASKGRAAAHGDGAYIDACGPLLRTLCHTAAAHYAPAGRGAASARRADAGGCGASANAGRGAGGSAAGIAGRRAAPRVASRELPAMLCQPSAAASIGAAMEVVRWSALSGVGIYGCKLGSARPKALTKRPASAPGFVKCAAGGAMPVLCAESGASAAPKPDGGRAACRQGVGNGKAPAAAATLKRPLSKNGAQTPGESPHRASPGSAAKRPKSSPEAAGEPSGGVGGSKGAAAPPHRAPQPSRPALPPDNARTRVMPSALRVLLSMGYLRADAESALRRTGGNDVQSAIEVLAGERA